MRIISDSSLPSIIPPLIRRKGGTGQVISRLTNDEIDVAMWVLNSYSAHAIIIIHQYHHLAVLSLTHLSPA